jgi:predicted nucleic acid-binding protein
VIAYVDSSVVVRILFGQDRQLAEWPNLAGIYASELLRVETMRTIDRATLRAAEPPDIVARLRAAAFDLLSRAQLIEISSAVLDRAAEPFPTPLGTLDAIHLATALALAQEYPAMQLATHDQELADAARSVGLEVLGA